jgi:hypothetical protein
LDDFDFYSFWEALPKRYKVALTDIADQLSHEAYTNNETEIKEEDSWGGPVFWDFIYTHEKGRAEQRAFRDAFGKSLSITFTTAKKSAIKDLVN